MSETLLEARELHAEGLAPQIAGEIWRIVGEIREHGIATVIPHGRRQGP
jgi:ABC-type branched-subunit amino acid transport system ATPase component